jgi:serine/threonine protein kinase
MFPSPGGVHTRPEELFAGRYDVDGPLPWGGLVTYYRASAEGAPLIVCVLPMDTSRSLRSQAAFSELAHRLGAIQSRTIPQVLDAGIIDGVPYLAFQDTRGTLLSDVVCNRQLSSFDVLRLATDVLSGLDAAHAEGLVHGDLTPQNIVVTRDREGRLAARLVGIGILPLLRAYPDASAHAAHTGSGKHAVSYMAPELFGGGVVERGSDLYAVGALLYHMTTGAPPAMWETDEAFHDLPGLPEVIRRAMAKHPIQRYPDAASMRTALEWIEVESAKQTPHTQDIAPWMETSHIGSIPVSALNTSRPPAFVSSSHPPGKILSTSGARPIPIAPVVVHERDLDAKHHWIRIALLLALLGTLVFAGYWLEAQGDSTEVQIPAALGLESSDVP